MQSAEMPQPRAAWSAGYIPRSEANGYRASEALPAAAGKRAREDEGEGEEDWSAYAMPTTLSWQKLPASTLELFEEGMACVGVGEECAQEKKRRTAAGALRRASKEAPPSGLHVLASCASRSRESALSTSLPAVAFQAVNASPKSQPSRQSGRAQLDDASAVRIFLAKYASAEAVGSKSDLSGRLALQYGVTAKAVRDIWNMRTWKKATQPYWNVQPMHCGVLLRP
jgi:hypothetical protein